MQINILNTCVFDIIISPAPQQAEKENTGEDKMYLSLSIRKCMQGARNIPNPNDHKIICKTMNFAHKCKDMSVTLTLYSLASVCPPHLRLHGGPSASPCLMLFTGEQRIF